MAPISPTVAQWELNLRLRKRRKELGMEVKTITDAMKFTRNYWSIVENDRRILTEEHLRRICELFELSKAECQELLILRANAKERGWWSKYSALLDDRVSRLLGMEYGARMIRAYEGGVVTGLLQTEEYSHAIHTSSVYIRPADMELLIELRKRRQQRLYDEDPLRLTVILREAVLLQQVGGRDVLRRQLLHLIDLIERLPDSLDIRILPFTESDPDILAASTFYLLNFPSAQLPTLAWHEMGTFLGFVEDDNTVRDINTVYSRAHNRGLSQEDSLKRIERAASELK